LTISVNHSDFINDDDNLAKTLNSNWDVTIFVKAKRERFEWSEIKETLVTYAVGKPIILILIEPCYDESTGAVGTQLDRKIENVFCLLVDPSKKILHPKSKWEKIQEQSLINHLLSLSSQGT